MSIAILGWGSLLWDLDDLAPKVRGGWQMRAGPRLPMEFSRISPKRKLGLVVCLDPENGVPCATHTIESTRAALSDTVADLAARERAPLERIGFVGEGRSHSRLLAVIDAVEAWLETSPYAAVVWTDLEPNFAEVRGEPFSVQRGMAYLQTLSGENWDEAYRYISEAPADTDTPLRRALAAQPWWHA
ncbi:MAG: hypothetical protein AAFQ36_06805 [Pseudomonadota bacterium]